MKTILILFLLLINLSVLAQKDKESIITQKLDSLSKSNSLVGFGVAVFNKDSLLYANGFGLSNKEKKTDYTVNTVQKIASISKLLLGVSLMKAQELHLLNLDDPINNYLPFPLINSRIAKSNITIRELASHTSGLKKNQKYDIKALCFPTKIPKIKSEMHFGFRKLGMNIYAKMVNKNEYMPLQKYLYEIYSPKGKWYSKKHFKKIETGEQEIYSNQGASFIALIIEKVSGITYSDFVKKYVLNELQMHNSGFDFEMQNYHQENKASLYHNNVEVPNDFKLILYPAGGFETSIEDFSKFMITMAGGLSHGNSILTEHSYNEMVELPEKTDMYHAVLWETYSDSIVGHKGDIAGVATYTYYNREFDKGYILFSNTAGQKKNYEEITKIIKLLKDY